jgi:hypothetical protein
MKKWNQENIVNNKEHDAVFEAAGISREQVWIQHSKEILQWQVMRQLTLNNHSKNWLHPMNPGL